jgi:hypothetical protein
VWFLRGSFVVHVGAVLKSTVRTAGACLFASVVSFSDVCSRKDHLLGVLILRFPLVAFYTFLTIFLSLNEIPTSSRKRADARPSFRVRVGRIAADASAVGWARQSWLVDHACIAWPMAGPGGMARRIIGRERDMSRRRS